MSKDECNKEYYINELEPLFRGRYADENLSEEHFTRYMFLMVKLQDPPQRQAYEHLTRKYKLAGPLASIDLSHAFYVAEFEPMFKGYYVDKTIGYEWFSQWGSLVRSMGEEAQMRAYGQLSEKYAAMDPIGKIVLRAAARWNRKHGNDDSKPAAVPSPAGHD